MSKQETTPPEKLHIKGAGGMIISKSVLNGEQPLKWLLALVMTMNMLIMRII